MTRYKTLEGFSVVGAKIDGAKYFLFADKSSVGDYVVSSTALILQYQTLTVMNEVETYIYDTGSFLASVGGNLGLLLGFSCFTVILGFIDLIKKFSDKRISGAIIKKL